MRLVREAASLRHDLDHVADRRQQLLLFGVQFDIDAAAEHLCQPRRGIFGLAAERVHLIDEPLETCERTRGLSSISIGHDFPASRGWGTRGQRIEYRAVETKNKSEILLLNLLQRGRAQARSVDCRFLIGWSTLRPPRIDASVRIGGAFRAYADAEPVTRIWSSIDEGRRPACIRQRSPSPRRPPRPRTAHSPAPCAARVWLRRRSARCSKSEARSWSEVRAPGIRGVDQEAGPLRTARRTPGAQC